MSPPAYDSNRGQSWNVRGDAGSHFPKPGAVWSERNGLGAICGSHVENIACEETFERRAISRIWGLLSLLSLLGPPAA